jgi:cytoskeletal protein CcmA (bactofilin family)
MVGSQPKEAPVSKKSSSSNSRENSVPQGSTCVIAIGTVLEGNFSSTESIRIDGTVVGEVRCEKRLVVGKNGKIEGNVYAQEATIKGVVDGTLIVKKYLHMEGTANVSGSIQAGAMSVEEGALFNGDSQVSAKEK